MKFIILLIQLRDLLETYTDDGNIGEDIKSFIKHNRRSNRKIYEVV